MKRINPSPITILFFILIILSNFSCKKEKEKEDDPIPLKVPITTKVIENQVWETNIVSIDSSNYTIFFKKELLTNQPLKVGDVIVSTVGQGLLRRISKITEIDDEIKIETEFARLTDVVNEGTASIQSILSTQKIMSIIYHNNGVKLDTSKSKELENSQLEYNIDVFLDPEEKVHIHGDFSILTEMIGEIEIKYFPPKISLFEIKYEVEQNLNLSAEIQLIDMSFDKEVNLVSVYFQPITVLISGIPIILVPELEIAAGIESTVYCDVNTSISEDMKYSMGIHYEDKQWTTINEFTKTFSYSPPQINCNAEATVYIKPQLNVTIYGVVSPYLFGNLYGNIQADINNTPWWELYAGANLGVGVKAEIWGYEMPDYHTDPPLIDYKQLVASSTTVNEPLANFSATPTSGVLPLNVNFTDQSLNNPTTWNWDFGDGSESTQQNPTHIYTVEGLYSVSLTVSNESGENTKTKQNYITVTNPSSTLPTLTTLNISEITQTTASSGGNITDDGGSSISARGICWSVASTPTILDNITNDGTGIGGYTSSLTGLEENTTYFVRAYATNNDGTAYGNEVEFTTPSSSSLPTIITNEVTEITQTTALSGGDVIDDGGSSITNRGVCWSTEPNPTIEDNTTEDGSGMGSFISSITSLTENTTYYVCAYATNGEGTAYGNQIQFTTESDNTVTDYDGNVYETVQISNQIWMKENLKVTHYADGTAIPLITDNTIWGNLGDNNFERAYSYYNNNSAFGNTYGCLYTYSAVTNGDISGNIQGICPSNWHLPSIAEWTTLIDNLGGENIAGGKMKEVGLIHWNNPNEGATNLSNFTALPGGIRNNVNGVFGFLGNEGNWWSSTNSYGGTAWYIKLNYNNTEVNKSSGGSKSRGYSCRCIKD